MVSTANVWERADGRGLEARPQRPLDVLAVSRLKNSSRDAKPVLKGRVPLLLQPGRIHQPVGLADPSLAGVGGEPDVQAIAIGLVNHRQTVMGLECCKG